MNSAKRIYKRIEDLARFSDTEEGLCRLFCSKSARNVNELIAKWVEEDQLSMKLDALANVRLRSKQFDPSRQTFVIGSHLDSVINAGKYDGPLGFLIGYEMLAHAEQHRLQLPFNLEVVGFSDEEGIRYQTTFLGSSALAGTFKEEWLDRADSNGVKMRDALQSFHCHPESIPDCAISADKLLGYYEVHIEQGPLLQKHQLPLGVVTHIFGQARLGITFNGRAGHAGTVPMDLREDALCAFSEFNVRMESFALERKEDLVATIGKCEVKPGASNVIPAQVLASIDIRSANEWILKSAKSEIRQLALEVAARRGVQMQWDDIQETQPTICDPYFVQVLEETLSEHQNKVLKLSSGAGHDAVAISAVAPVCMLFVRCKDGISHHPDEFVSEEDIAKALKVSLAFLEKLKKHHQ